MKLRIQKNKLVIRLANTEQKDIYTNNGGGEALGEIMDFRIDLIESSEPEVIMKDNLLLISIPINSWSSWMVSGKISMDNFKSNGIEVVIENDLR